jgi:hypothetical protein
MKKLLILLILVFVGIVLQAQNNFTNYKAVVANASGTVLTNQSVSVRFTLYDGANPVFTETHNTTTDTHGIIVLEMGSANPTDWNNLTWNSVSFSLKTEYNTGSGFVDMGTKPFQYVPYAKYATLAGTAITADYQNLTNKPAVFYVNNTTNVATQFNEDVVHEGAMVLGVDLSNPYTKLTINFAQNSNEESDSYGISVRNTNHDNTFTKTGYTYESNSNSTMPDTGYASGFSGNSDADKTGQVNYFTNTGNGNQIGLYNVHSGSGSGLHAGVKNEFTGSSTGNMTGVLNWLSANGDGLQFATSNLVQGSGTGMHSGTVNEITGDGTGEQIGNYNIISNGGTTSAHYGVKNLIDSYGLYRYGVFTKITGNQSSVFEYGVRNELDGTMSNEKYGIYNSLTGAGYKNGLYQILTQGPGTEEVRGVYNEIITSGSGLSYGTTNNISQIGNGTVVANFNQLSTASSNTHEQFAVKNSVYSLGSGTHNGNYTSLEGTGQGAQYGSNINISNTGNAEHIGSVHNLSGVGNGVQVGVLNQITNTGSGSHIGLKNVLTGSTTGQQFGIFNDLNVTNNNDLQIGTRNGVSGNGIGPVYGSYNYITGNGSGDKYGQLCYIPNTIGGTHYGVQSDVTKADSYAGYFLGNVFVSGVFTNPSDESLKQNIKLNSGVLNKIMQLQVKDYEFKPEEKKQFGFPDGVQTGFIAQEMELVLPNLVQNTVLHKSQTEENSTKIADQNIKTINYIGLIPILTKAIQEQQEQIDAYQKENAKQEAKIQDLEQKLMQLIQVVEQLKNQGDE